MDGSYSHASQGIPDGLMSIWTPLELKDKKNDNNAVISVSLLSLAKQRKRLLANDV